MARLFSTYTVKVTPTVNPHTMVQVLAPAEQRLVVSVGVLTPFGSTGASTNIELDWREQTDHGSMVEDTSRLVKVPPVTAVETLQAKIWKLTGTTEPAATAEPLFGFGLHQQSARIWTPTVPYQELVIEGAKMFGLRWLAGFFSIPMLLQLSIEE